MINKFYCYSNTLFYKVEQPPTTRLQNFNEKTPLLSATINTEADPELQPIIGFKTALKTRVRSLDVFRGITIVGMILVDNQGELMNKNKQIFWPIDESSVSTFKINENNQDTNHIIVEWTET